MKKKKILGFLAIFAFAIFVLICVLKFVSNNKKSSEKEDIENNYVELSQSTSNERSFDLNTPFIVKDRSGNVLDFLTKDNVVPIEGYYTFGEMVDDGSVDDRERYSICMNNQDLFEKAVIIIDHHCFDIENYPIVGPIQCDGSFGSIGNSHFDALVEDSCGIDFYGITNSLEFISKITNDGFDEYLHNPHFDFMLLNCTYEEKDTTAPVFGGTIHASVNVDSQPSIEEIVSHVYAKDETDGYVPIKVESSTYVQGIMEVGDYSINVSASDSNSNKSTAVINVHRYDNTGPVISGTNSYDLNYNHDITLEKIESALTITDNVDSGLVLEKVSDTFSGNEHILGNYQIVYRSKDLSNNYGANYTIDLAVENKGTATIGGSREIHVGTNTILTLEEFKSKVSVVDGYDGKILNYIIEGFDDYTNTSKVVGVNIVQVSYTNSGGNTAFADFKIIKEDRISPEILFDNYFILLKQGEVFTLDMVISQAAQVLCLSIDEIVDVKGDYDTSVVGNYNLDVCLASGETKTFELTVVDNYDDVSNSSKGNWGDFFSPDGYIDNMFKPKYWTAYHYLTILAMAGIAIITIVVIVLVKKKKKINYYD